MISKTAIIYPDVELGKNVIVEDYCIIGAPVSGENLKTTIGDNAHIRSHTVVYAGNKIGHNFKTGNKANIREKNVIGNNVSIGTLSVIEHQVQIEDNVRIHSQSFIPEFSVLKKGSWVGPNVVFTNAKYPLHPDSKKNLKGPMLLEDCKIGANSTLLPGVVIGKSAMVGAGSVVTKDVLDFDTVIGNPAVSIKKN